MSSYKTKFEKTSGFGRILLAESIAKTHILKKKIHSKNLKLLYLTYLMAKTNTLLMHNFYILGFNKYFLLIVITIFNNQGIFLKKTCQPLK